MGKIKRQIESIIMNWTSSAGKALWQRRLLLILAIIPLIGSILIYLGIFESTMEIISYEVGVVNSETPIPNDYTLFVRYQSKGAFIAGRKIHVIVEFRGIRNVDSLRESEIAIHFIGSVDINAPRMMHGVMESVVFLHFDSTNIALAETDLIYMDHQLLSKKALLNFENFGRFTYILTFDSIPQPVSRFVRINPFLYLAPLETELQLKTNNIMLILAFLAVYISIVQITFRVKRSSNSG